MLCVRTVCFFFEKPIRTVITISVTGNESAGFVSAAAAGLAASRNELVFFLFFFLGLRREFFYIPCIIALIPCVWHIRILAYPPWLQHCRFQLRFLLLFLMKWNRFQLRSLQVSAPLLLSQASSPRVLLRGRKWAAGMGWKAVIGCDSSLECSGMCYSRLSHILILVLGYGVVICGYTTI